MADLISRKQAMALGMKTYRTGKVCPHGHMESRYVSNHKCIGCTKEESKAKLELQRLKYKNDPAHAERLRQNARKNHLLIKNDPQRLAEKNIKNAAYARKKRASDPVFLEKQRINSRVYKKNWSELQKQKHRIHAKNRKAALKGAVGKFTINDVRHIFDFQNGRCLSCDANLGVEFHVDHVMPIKLGGSNYPENLQLLCAPCNLSKAAKHPDVWKAEIRKGVEDVQR